MQQEILLSKKQLETLKDFFSGEYLEILYGGGARGGKSYLIGLLIGICIAAFPGSSWLVSRTVLSELQATTLTTFFQVIQMLGFGPKSYKDKIREKKRIEFANGSNVYVIQVNNEPSDPEFDRLGSYSYTGAFLDEGQQMVTKVRSVLDGRFSETSGSFKTEIPRPKDDNFSLNYSIRIKVVGETAFTREDLTVESHEVVKSGKHYCAIVDYYDLVLPYKVVDYQPKGDKAIVELVWNFSPVVLISCNPGKNFTYTDFYKPYKKGLAEGDEFKYLTVKTFDGKELKRKFIQALVTDNPFVEKSYIYRLQASKDEVTKQRLLYGNFEYDDDPRLLFDVDMLTNLYKPLLNDSETYYLTVDAARKGKDLTIIYLWKGLDLVKIDKIDSGTLTEQKDYIQKEYIDKYYINLTNVIVDEVGVGGGLVDLLGCRGFIANQAPMQPYAAKYLPYKKRNYANLRTQAFYYLQQYVRDGKIRIKCTETEQEIINEELLFIKQVNVDGDSKIQLESKKDMKALLGRSPDYADALSFRMYWIIKNHHEGNIDPADDKEEEQELHDELLIDEKEQEQDRLGDDDFDLSIY